MRRAAARQRGAGGRVFSEAASEEVAARRCSKAAAKRAEALAAQAAKKAAAKELGAGVAWAAGARAHAGGRQKPAEAAAAPWQVEEADSDELVQQQVAAFMDWHKQQAGGAEDQCQGSGGQPVDDVDEGSDGLEYDEVETAAGA